MPLRAISDKETVLTRPWPFLYSVDPALGLVRNLPPARPQLAVPPAASEAAASRKELTGHDARSVFRGLASQTEAAPSARRRADALPEIVLGWKAPV
jgi:hypothetical protein